MKCVFAAALAATGLFVAASASAETLDVTLSLDVPVGAGFAPEVVATWVQDSNPTPITFAIMDNTRVPISDFASPVGLKTETFIDYIGVGGFQLILENNQAETQGSQIYSGLESAPVFAPGSFDGLGEGLFRFEITPGAFVSLASNITFTVAQDVPVPPNPTAAPEPSTWALGLAGFSAVALMYGLRCRERAGEGPQAIT
jgi:hypothetical protein